MSTSSSTPSITETLTHLVNKYFSTHALNPLQLSADKSMLNVNLSYSTEPLSYMVTLCSLARTNVHRSWLDSLLVHLKDVKKNKEEKLKKQLQQAQSSIQVEDEGEDTQSSSTSSSVQAAAAGARALQELAEAKVPDSVLTASASLLIQSFSTVPQFITGAASFKLTIDSLNRQINTLMSMMFNVIILRDSARPDHLFEPVVPTLLNPLPTQYSHNTPKRETHEVWEWWISTFKVNRYNAKTACGSAVALTSSLFPFGLCTYERWLYPLLSKLSVGGINSEFVRFLVIVWPVALKDRTIEQQVETLEQVFFASSADSEFKSKGKAADSWLQFIDTVLSESEQKRDELFPGRTLESLSPEEVTKLRFWAMHKRLVAYKWSQYSSHGVSLYDTQAFNAASLSEEENKVMSNAIQVLHHLADCEPLNVKLLATGLLSVIFLVLSCSFYIIIS